MISDRDGVRGPGKTLKSGRPDSVSKTLKKRPAESNTHIRWLFFGLHSHKWKVPPNTQYHVVFEVSEFSGCGLMVWRPGLAEYRCSLSTVTFKKHESEYGSTAQALIDKSNPENSKHGRGEGASLLHAQSHRRRQCAGRVEERLQHDL